MTRIAVTGASGFIGRYVLSALSRRDVVAHARTPRIEHAGAPWRWTYFDINDCDDAFERLGRPDTLIHLAWEGLPNYLGMRHIEVELPAQGHFLQQLIVSGLKTLVVVGTCFEYGMQSGCLREDTPPMPTNPYGYAKDALRRDLMAIAEELPFDLRWLRLFYTYGTGRTEGLYAAFEAAVARGDRQFNMSPGDQLRDFIRIQDAASAIVHAALAREAPTILNVCTGEPVSVREIVERWRTEMNSSIELNLGALGYPRYEPFAFWGDDTRLAALMGHAQLPTVTRASGIRRAMR